MFDDIPNPKNVRGAKISERMLILVVIGLALFGAYHILSGA